MYKLLFVLTLCSIAITLRAQSTANGKLKGHGYVDLGLSVKWATCNVGANSPSDYGDYFAWGEAKTKSTYTESNSATYERATYTFLDAASLNWGSAWRIPTKAECQELIDNCIWIWTTVGGHDGYKVTSKKNGNSIFLPAGGIRRGSEHNGTGEYGFCWTSQPHDIQSPYASDGAYSLHFGSDVPVVDWCNRDRGISVRPVTE